MRAAIAASLGLTLILVLAACAGDVAVSTEPGPTSTSAEVVADVPAASTLVPEPAAPASAPPPPPPEAPAARLAPPVTNLDRPGALPEGEDTTIESVVDGDTIVVSGGRRVRLIGVDTPETKDPRQSVQCFGPEASTRTAGLLEPGTPVRLVYDVERFDRYGRTLAYVHRLADGLFVNAALVADGYALVATFPPNVAHAEDFTALARVAREQKRGLWSTCGGDPTVAAAPATAPAPPPSGACEGSYPGVCIPPAPPDLDCGDVADRRFQVVPPDPHRFDGDGDGVGCES